MGVPAEGGPVEVAAWVTRLRDEPLRTPARGLPSVGGDVSVASLAGRALNVTRGDVELPALVLYESALRNNLALMTDFVATRHVLLAPHGKTTMAPALFRRQLDAGAWAITTANIRQAGVAFDAGARRVLIANEIVGDSDIAWVSAVIGDDGRELYCLVDSVAGVERLQRGLSGSIAPDGRADAPRQLRLLVELGFVGGRTGVRSLATALEVAAAVSEAPHLKLVGVEGYEGGIASDRTPDALSTVDGYLERIRELTVELAGRGCFPGPEPILVTAGGSKYFDRVVDVLGPGADYGVHEVRLVIRPGCYLTHDHGIYLTSSPLTAPDDAGRALVPALEVWADVLSTPEAGLAIVNLGKRDVSYDLGLPVPLHVVRDGRVGAGSLSGAQLVALDDQHGYLRTDDHDQVSVGDRVGFGLSHPCTALDKWDTVLVVDGGGTVVDAVRTVFG